MHSQCNFYLRETLLRVILNSIFILEANKCLKIFPPIAKFPIEFFIKNRDGIFRDSLRFIKFLKEIWLRFY